MTPASQFPRTTRRDGWTAERRRQFLDGLLSGLDVRRACARVGLSREGAYRLRGRDAAFAPAWDEARRAARAAEDERFLASLPEKLRRTMSELSGRCELRGPQGSVRMSGGCELRAAQSCPWTPFQAFRRVNLRELSQLDLGSPEPHRPAPPRPRRR